MEIGTRLRTKRSWQTWEELPRESGGPRKLSGSFDRTCNGTPEQGLFKISLNLNCHESVYFIIKLQYS